MEGSNAKSNSNKTPFSLLLTGRSRIQRENFASVKSLFNNSLGSSVSNVSPFLILEVKLLIAFSPSNIVGMKCQKYAERPNRTPEERLNDFLVDSGVGRGGTSFSNLELVTE